MSNYNDIEPLIADQEVFVEFVSSNIALDKFDLLILPGSKLVIKDLKWLKDTGLFENIKSFQKDIFVICGGYEMMFNTLNDKYALENDTAIIEKGFALIDDEVVFEKNKILKKSSYKIFGFDINGFEIHHGVSKKYPLEYENEKLKGTFIHGIFDNDEFRTDYFKSICDEYKGFIFKSYKESKVDEFVNKMKSQLDVKRILNSVL